MYFSKCSGVKFVRFSVKTCLYVEKEQFQKFFQKIYFQKKKFFSENPYTEIHFRSNDEENFADLVVILRIFRNYDLKSEKIGEIGEKSQKCQNRFF